MTNATASSAPHDNGYLNFLWSRHFVAALAAAGVGHAVISPGSRSTPLALALLRQPGLDCQVVVDERSAAFLALGLAKGTGQPVALLCTSGSAPAHWLPAVIEADATGVPLLLLSADRPPELHGWGANQTVEQLRLFDGYVRASHALGAPEGQLEPRQIHTLAARLVAESRWPDPGPVHANIPFREPLLPPPDMLGQLSEPLLPAPATSLYTRSPQMPPAPEAIAQAAIHLGGRPGVILAGGLIPDGQTVALAAAMVALAERLDCPILADPLSGLRHGPHARQRCLAHGEALLRDPDFTATHRPAWILRFGQPPVSKALLNWQSQCLQGGSELWLVEERGRWPDPDRLSTALIRGEPTRVAQALYQALAPQAITNWQTAWSAAEARCASRAAEALAVADAPLWEGALVADLVAALPVDSQLFWGNSMAVRDGDAFSGLSDKTLWHHGNRGASGIDGQFSTALGLARAAHGQDRRTAALIGDLAAHHDLNALSLARELDCLLVVINNGGGGIFEYLPQRGLPEYEAGWLTPVALDLAQAAAAYGLPFTRAHSRAEYQAQLDTALSRGGPCLIEVVVEREASVARHRQYWAGSSKSPD